MCWFCANTEAAEEDMDDASDLWGDVRTRRIGRKVYQLRTRSERFRFRLASLLHRIGLG